MATLRLLFSQHCIRKGSDNTLLCFQGLPDGKTPLRGVVVDKSREYPRNIKKSGSHVRNLAGGHRR